MLFLAGIAAKAQSNRLRVGDSRTTSRPRKPHKVVTFADDLQTETLPANQRLASLRVSSVETDKLISSNNYSEAESRLGKINTDAVGCATALGDFKKDVGTAASSEVTVGDRIADNNNVLLEEPEINMDLDERCVIT